MASTQPGWVVIDVLRGVVVRGTLSYVTTAATADICCTTVEQIATALDDFLESALQPDQEPSKGIGRPLSSSVDGPPPSEKATKVFDLCCGITKITQATAPPLFQGLASRAQRCRPSNASTACKRNSVLPTGSESRSMVLVVPPIASPRDQTRDRRGRD